MASLPGTTGTDIESACKHQIACRVDFEHMLSWVGYDNNKLERDTHKWSMAQYDLVVGLSKPLRANEPGRTNTRNKAYPAVVVTVAEMERAAMNYLIYLYHNSLTMRDRDQIIMGVENTIDYWVTNAVNPDHAKKQIQEMPDFYAVGVSVGSALAHPNSGDNMATSMIGGLKTVYNGAFQIYAGDLIQWYWEEERPCFLADGRRVPELIEGENGMLTSDHVSRFLEQAPAVADDDERRRKFYDRVNANYGPVRNGKTRMAFPKPFRYDDNNERIHDRMRVFAKALIAARPYEKVDIMIARQSL